MAPRHGEGQPYWSVVSSVPGKYNNNNLQSHKQHGPKYPAQGGANISGDQTHGVELH